MLDINNIRENKKEVEESLLKRMEKKKLDLDKILKLDDERKEIIVKVEDLKARRNRQAKSKPTAEVRLEMKKVGEEISKLDEELKVKEDELNKKLAELPNIVAEEVPAGGKENNKMIKAFGSKPDFSFKAKDHMELAVGLGLIDYERAAKMSGAGWWVYRGDGALLEWALLNYFISYHRKSGYEFLLPPYLLNEASAFASGHLPKFRDDLFWVEDGLCLNATSEMMVTNYHRDEILDELPKKYFAFSTCFRREAGSYRKEERGMIRGHQFNKIEMFQFTHPDKSGDGFNELLKCAEDLLEGLGLHYQTSLLAAGDASAAMAKTVDLEVWIPSMGMYKEVSSVSNALDYQARRANIRFKDKHRGKNEFVHTLNASGLATSRLTPAILEQFQEKDGRVKIPEVLQDFMGKDYLGK